MFPPYNTEADALVPDVRPAADAIAGSGEPAVAEPAATAEYASNTITHSFLFTILTPISMLRLLGL